MRLLADLHTHSTASGHAYSSISELAAAASLRGLECIAVTDHGPALHGAPTVMYFWNLRVLPVFESGVLVLTGCEANVLANSENGLDMPDEIIERLDIVGVGLHPFTGMDDADEDELTEALVRAMSDPLVDFVTHPGNASRPAVMDAVISTAVEHGVALELNDHSFQPHSTRAASAGREEAFAAAAFEAGVPIVIGSDAHHASRVGEFEQAMAAAERIGLSEDKVVNRDAASVFEFLRSRRERPRLEGIDAAIVAARGGIDGE